HRITGAAVVEITGRSSSPGRVPAAAPPHDVAAVDADTLVSTAIVAHLQQVTGHQRWQVEIESGEALLARVGESGPISEVIGEAPWTGRRQFRLRQPGNLELIAVTVRVERLDPVVVARRAINRGDLIRESDVELQWVAKSHPPQTANALPAVVGKEARQSIRSGSTIQHYQIQPPMIVRRGDLVEIFVQTGGVAARTKAVARQDGSLGEMVQVETFDSKERIVARVSGPRLLEVVVGASSVDQTSTIRYARATPR
ncbi:MAG: flagellar basal body P-ring formation chaperone FlgA, partial [Planctomycetota bacterium]